MKENIQTGIIGSLFGLIWAAIVASWQVIVVIAIIYAIGLFGNLVTGLMYARQTNSYSEDKARHAIYKKGGVIVGILALFALDLIVMGLGRYLGITYNIPLFGTIYTGYVSAHEYKSMFENIKKLGNKIPKILEDAADKAVEALDKGKVPNIEEILKEKGDSNV